MNTSSDNNFEHYSEQSLNAVEMVEFLPDSIAFEHVMYDYRIKRTATYEFSHQDDNRKDLDPLVIDPSLMVSQFPESLKNIFPGVRYTIEQLQISQVETANSDSISISFLANGTPHDAVINEGVVKYTTHNESMEPVHYGVEPNAITGLIASFLYARQYDPSETIHNTIGLIEPTIITPRDSRIDLIERMIMSLGDHSGSAATQTQSVFDSASSAPIVATLTNREFPDKSTTASSLSLSELGSFNDILSSVETTLYQNFVNIEHPLPFIGSGRLTNRYAEQRSYVLSALAIPTSELIDPKANYARWAHTCLTFMNLIKTPMSVYIELDETRSLD